MSNRTRLLVLFAAILVIGGALFFIPTSTAGSRPLLAEVTQSAVNSADRTTEYNINFKKDTNTANLTGIWLLTEKMPSGLYRLSFQITHPESVLLKSLAMDFNNIQPSSALLLSTPGGAPVPPLEFHSIQPSSGGATLRVSDFGTLGTGNINFQFFLDGSAIQAADKALDMTISLKIFESGKVDAGEQYSSVPLNVILPE